MKLSFVSLQTKKALKILVWVQLNSKLNYPHTKEITFLPALLGSWGIPGDLEAKSLEIFQAQGAPGWSLNGLWAEAGGHTERWQKHCFSRVGKDIFCTDFPVLLFPRASGGLWQFFRDRGIACDREIGVVVWFLFNLLMASLQIIGLMQTRN